MSRTSTSSRDIFDYSSSQDNQDNFNNGIELDIQSSNDNDHYENEPFHHNTNNTTDYEESATNISASQAQFSVLGNQEDPESPHEDDPVYADEALISITDIFEIPKLGGLTEYIFSENIYHFLSAKDLCHLGS